MLAHEKRQPPKNASGKVTPGFESTQTDPHAPKDWQPFFERTIRAGIAGYRLVRVRSALRHSEPPECRYCGDRGSASLPLLRTGYGLWQQTDRPVVRKDDQDHQRRKPCYLQYSLHRIRVRIWHHPCGQITSKFQVQDATAFPHSFRGGSAITNMSSERQNARCEFPASSTAYGNQTRTSR